MSRAAFARGAWLACLISGLVATSLSGQPVCDAFGAARVHACLHPGDGPTIVLAAGAGQDSRTWARLVDDLTEIGSVVTFDRPGFGRSPESEGPRTPTAIAQELRDALTGLGVSDPVFIVGHSMGGVHALRYADLFPESVAGVLMLDAPPPDFEEARLRLLTPAQREERLMALAEGRARARRVVGLERDGAAAEAWRFEAVPGSLRLIVVVADGQDFGHPESQAAHRELWAEMSEAWLGLSYRSELVVAEGSGHMVHVERPELVIELVRRLTSRREF